MKTLRFLFIIILTIFSNYTLNAEENLSRNVIISGQVINLTENSEKVITAINCNPWSDKISRHAVEIDANGRFSTYVEIPFGHNFTVYYDRAFFCQYAEPGDSLFLTIDAANLKSGARYSGSHEKLNNEYGKAYADLFSISFVELPSGEMPKEEYLENFKKIYSGLENSLKHYADSVRLGNEAKDLMSRSLLFSLANSALGHKDKTPERVLEFFEDSIFGLDDRDNMREMMFPYHLSAYVNRLERVVRPDSVSQLIEAIVERHPKSLNRDVMIAMYLTQAEEGYPTFSQELFCNPDIYEMLYGQETNDEQLQDVELTEGVIYEFKNGEISKCGHSSLTELLRKEFKGKTVYLDLWATWCAPCLQSNKSLPEVAEFFKNKNLVFVSVALKSDIDKWKKLVRDRPENCRDFFVNSDADAELIMSAFGMNGFPAYRILGRDSNIINQNPPRPNNPAIYNVLQGLE